MNIPITIGLPQIILLIIALIGIVLLISFASKHIRGETRKSDEYEDFRKFGMKHRHHRS
jgi:hypothetical protein